MAEQRTRKLRQRAVLSLLFAAIIIALIVFANWYFSFKTVRLEPSQGSTIILAHGTGHGDEILKTITKATSPTTVRVEEGKYVVAYEADGFARKSETIEVNKNVTLKTPELNYSDSRLTSMLENERAVIHNALDLETDLPGYAIYYEKLYHHGEWYAAVLTPPEYNGTTTTQRVVFQKKDNQWKLAAGPGLVLTFDEYHGVLHDAIFDVNNH